MSSPLEWRGKVFHRADVIPEPHHGSPARPYDIPIKGDFDSTSGELGIVKVTVRNEVERIVMFPPRGGVYDKRNAIVQQPHYYRRDETGKKHRVYMVQCIQCGDYQRREAFSADTRKRNGLQSICKTCHADNMRRARLTAKAA